MSRKFLSHLQFKLIGVICLILLVTLGAVSFVTYKKTDTILAKNSADLQQAIARDYAREVEFEFNVLLNDVYCIATSEQMTNATDKNQIRQILRKEFKRFPMFSALWYFDLDGISIDTTGLETKSDEREYFQIVKRTQKPYVSNPYISKVTGKFVVAVVYPVFRNGKMDGMINAVYPSDKILEKVQQAKFGKTGYAILVGGDGLVVADGDNADLVGKVSFLKQDIPDALNLAQKNLDERVLKSTKEALSGNIVQTSYTNYDNNSKYAVFRPVQLGEQQRWGLIITTETKEIYEDANNLLKWILLVSLIGLLISGAIAYSFGRKFTKPILAINQEMALVAQGDLRKHSISVTSSDELGQMVKSFLIMRDSLINIVEKVQHESQQVAAASEELTASAEQSAQAANQVASSITEVAQGTDKQHHVVSETAEIVGQMSESIQQVAANANVLSQQSTKAAETAKEGGKSVEGAVKQMTEIEYTVSCSAQVVARLGERSKEIGQIVDTISGIAGQTNLLALNAAIEAARAGEQGRGFAVVAEEVRKLAEQSQEAAKQIAHLISEIQGETDKAVSAMDEGTRDVKVGTGIVNEAGKAFQEIISLVDNLAGQIEEISAAIRKLASGSQKIVSSVQQIDQLTAATTGEAQTVSAATEEQSASMEEIASSSQSLAKMAQGLQEVVNKFRI